MDFAFFSSNSVDPGINSLELDVDIFGAGFSITPIHIQHMIIVHQQQNVKCIR